MRTLDFLSSKTILENGFEAVDEPPQNPSLSRHLPSGFNGVKNPETQKYKTQVARRFLIGNITGKTKIRLDL